MKKIILGFVLLVTVSFSFGLTPAERYFDRVDTRLASEEIKLTSDIPNELAQSYHTEMESIRNEIRNFSWMYYNSDRVSSETRRAVNKILTTRFRDLVQDHKEYLKTQKSVYLFDVSEKSSAHAEVLRYQNALLDMIEDWIGSALQNRRDEAKFSFLVQNTEVQGILSAPEIISVTDVGTGRQSFSVKMDLDVKLTGGDYVSKPTTVKGNITLRAVTEPGYVYLALDAFDVQATGDEDIVEMVGEAREDAQEFMSKLQGRFMRIATYTDELSMSSPALLKKAIEILRVKPLFTPFKKIAEGYYMLSFHPDTMNELSRIYGNDEEPVTDYRSLDLYLDMSDSSNTRLGDERNCDTEKNDCSYLLRTRYGVGFQAQGDDFSVFSQNIRSDWNIGIDSAYEDFTLNLLWKNKQLTADFAFSEEDKKHTLGISGPLSQENTNLTFTFDGESRGTFLWQTNGMNRTIKARLLLWDPLRTSVDYTFDSKGYPSVVTLTAPTNIVDEFEISGDTGNVDNHEEDAYTYTPEYVSGFLTPRQISSMAKGRARMTLGENVRNKPIILLFSDIECPFCTRLIASFDLQNPKDFPFNATLIYKHFPLPFHDQAMTWAQQSICEYNLSGGAVFFRSLARHAQNGGDYELALTSDAKALKTCFDNNKKDKTLDTLIQKDQEDAKVFDVNGTPTMVIINPKTGHYVVVSGAVPLSDIENAASQAMAE